MSMIQDIKNKNYDGYTVIKSEANPNANPGYDKDIWNSVNDEMGTEKNSNGTGYKSSDSAHRAAVKAEYFKRLNSKYSPKEEEQPVTLPAPEVTPASKPSYTPKPSFSPKPAPVQDYTPAPTKPTPQPSVPIFNPPNDEGTLSIDNSFNTTMNQSNTTTNTNETNVSDSIIYGSVGNQSNYTLNLQNNEQSDAKERAQNYVLNLL